MAESAGRPARAGSGARGAELARVEAAVRYINERAARGGLELARDVGEYVLEHFFDGELTRFRDTRGQKPRPFRLLLERDDLLLAPGAIYTFVRVAGQLRDLPRDTAGGLSLSHHRALLSLADLDQKVALARRALAEGWSKADLERRVRAQQPRRPQGRKRLPACVKATRRVARALDEAFSEPAVPTELRNLGEERLRATLEQVEHSLIRLQWMQATLEQALDE